MGCKLSNEFTVQECDARVDAIGNIAWYQIFSKIHDKRPDNNITEPLTL